MFVSLTKDCPSLGRIADEAYLYMPYSFKKQARDLVKDYDGSIVFVPMPHGMEIKLVEAAVDENNDDSNDLVYTCYDSGQTCLIVHHVEISTATAGAVFTVNYNKLEQSHSTLKTFSASSRKHDHSKPWRDFVHRTTVDVQYTSNPVMSVLTNSIRVISHDSKTDPEDIFACAPGLIFTDDQRNVHGDPSSTLVYLSRKYGEIKLKTADPASEIERQLYSHYLWNAGIKMAELVGEDDDMWKVENETVLELGAGAREVVLTDYPAPILLKNIMQNAASAIPRELPVKCRVEGHEWGIFDTSFAAQYEHSFSRVIAADCYWMPDQHFNLIRSMSYFLTLEQDARVFVVAGFHTGRAKLAAFFDLADQEGLDIEAIYEEDANGVRRPWMTARDGGAEDHRERNKWLVIARLRRKST
nr:protein n-methyltransferase nnt1 [Quercus suber]